MEPPARIVANPELCEGDLMSRDEVEEFIKDSIATLRILGDRKSPRYVEIREMYVADMAALVELGRLDEDEYEELVDERQLRF